MDSFIQQMCTEGSLCARHYLGIVETVTCGLRPPQAGRALLWLLRWLVTSALLSAHFWREPPPLAGPHPVTSQFREITGPGPLISACGNSEGISWLQNTTSLEVSGGSREATSQPRPASIPPSPQAPIPRALPDKPQAHYLHLRANSKERQKRIYTWLAVTRLLPVQEITAEAGREGGCFGVLVLRSVGGPASTVLASLPIFLPARGPRVLGLLPHY